MKKVFLVIATFIAFFTISAPVNAQQSDQWTEGITSGSSEFEDVVDAVCTHSAGSDTVVQTNSSPNASGMYRIKNLVSFATTYAVSLTNGNQFTWTGVVAGTHRLQVRRTTPADTNGWLSPGSGVTTFSGAFICPN